MPLAPATYEEGFVRGRWRQRWTWRRVGISPHLATVWVYPTGRRLSVTGQGLTIPGLRCLVSNEADPPPIVVTGDIAFVPYVAEIDGFTSEFQKDFVGPFHAVCVACLLLIGDSIDVALECS